MQVTVWGKRRVVLVAAYMEASPGRNDPTDTKDAEADLPALIDFFERRSPKP